MKQDVSGFVQTLLLLVRTKQESCVQKLIDCDPLNCSVVPPAMSASRRITRSMSSLVSSEDREAAAILMSLRSAPSLESCPSAACALCASSGRRVTRSQVYEAPEADDDYSDMPALIPVPINLPRFRRLEDADTDDDSDMPPLIPIASIQLEGRRAGHFADPTNAPTPTRPRRLASLRGLSDRVFEEVLGSLADATLETLRRTSDHALASEANLSAAQRALLLEEIRERSSGDTQAFSARRRRRHR